MLEKAEKLICKLLKNSSVIKNKDIYKIQIKSLKEICKCYDGVHQTPKYIDQGVPFVSVENIKNIYATNKFISLNDFNKYKIKTQKGDLFMTRIGDIGTCAVVENNDNLAYYVSLALLRPNQNIVLSKFLKYMIESEHGKKELNKRILHSACPIIINLTEISKLKFLIPPLTIQKHIVNILDKFYELINDLTKGLPQEIELRKKQYDYYCNKLLNFH
ncbi:restriction endonuclease subunit S [Mesomycoplasma lagogenitalium]|uniref:Restriction endonuclease subunit S n=1 Tax=Mesomycoplasma lagogenitalium TaxID=171286 RepID=A0ABY8LTX5_9BACT|nr:restriction endonuclease subunit S [Mesomycoplasma lagogenitalium]WGI36692.1 restriction endonuclease subunit S [Mesomycoplasma lagogenitalium]